eukprot:90859-Amphidinium_carterae.1
MRIRAMPYFVHPFRLRHRLWEIKLGSAKNTRLLFMLLCSASKTLAVTLHCLGNSQANVLAE